MTADDDGDPLTAVLVDGPTNGTLTLDPDGSFTYDPDPNFNGSDSFTYKADDGIDQSNVASVNITIDPVNDAPVADRRLGFDRSGRGRKPSMYWPTTPMWTPIR